MNIKEKTDKKKNNELLKAAEDVKKECEKIAAEMNRRHIKDIRITCIDKTIETKESNRAAAERLRKALHG